MQGTRYALEKGGRHWAHKSMVDLWTRKESTYLPPGSREPIVCTEMYVIVLVIEKTVESIDSTTLTIALQSPSCMMRTIRSAEMRVTKMVNCLVFGRDYSFLGPRP